MCWVALDCPCVYVKSHILCKMFFHGPVVSRDEQNMNKDHPLPFFMLHLSGNVPVCVVRLASFYGAYCRLYPPCYSTEYHWFMISIMVLLGHIPAAASCTKVENFNFAKHQQADRTSRFLGFCFQDLKSTIPEKRLSVLPMTVLIWTLHYVLSMLCLPPYFHADVISGIHTQLLSSTGSVHIVGLEGEVKSNRPPPHDTTFSHDIESIGENIHCQFSGGSYCTRLELSTNSVCLSVQCILRTRCWQCGVTAGREEDMVSVKCWKKPPTTGRSTGWCRQRSTTCFQLA